MAERPARPVSLCAMHVEVLAKILCFIPLKERMSTCSVLNKQFYEAAAAATTDIQVDLLCEHGRTESLTRFLADRGTAVSALTLSSPKDCRLDQLISPSLQQLHISSGSMQLALSSTHSTFSTCLTSLKIKHCVVLGHSISASQSLSELISLQHLSLKWCYASHGSVGECAVPPGMLATLSNLTYLNLSDSHKTTDSTLQALRAMPMLQKLVVKSNKVTAAVLAALHSPHRLQHLKLASDSLEISVRTVPQLPQFTMLQSLKLGSCTLAAGALAGMTQLQLLQLNSTRLQDGAALLDTLPKLQRLQRLRMCSLPCAWPPATAAYSALTASSQLTSLVICDCSLPAAWQYVFPTDKQLTALKVFEGWWRPSAGPPLFLPQHPTAPFSTGDVQRMSHACPNLLQLSAVVQPGVNLCALKQLSRLTELSVSGTNLRAPFRAVGMLTGLRSLSFWSRADAVIQQPWAPLLPLTALTQLTALDIITFMHGVPGDPGADLLDEGESFFWVKEEGDPSRDVWIQLLQELCSLDSDHTPYISALADGVARSQKELKAQQELLQQQAVQTAAQTARLSEQEQKVAEQQCRIVQLEHQLAAQQEAHAKGMAEMQGQLQQLLQTLQQGG